MSCVQKITMRGNASGVTIPQILMRQLNWMIGDYVVIERADDEIRIFRVRDLDKRPQRVKREEAPADAEA